MDQLDLSAFFTTKSQASDFSVRLAVVADQAYETGFNLENTLMQQFGIEKKDKFITLLRDQQINTGSAANLKDFLIKVQESVAAIPVLSLTLAFEPTVESMKALTDWFLLNLKKQVLFDVKVDTSIIGGALITFNGKFLDFSIKTKFDQVFQKVTSPNLETQKPALEQVDQKPVTTNQ